MKNEKQKKEKKMHNMPNEEVVLNIPEEEIYTYHIEGLAPPHINVPYKNFRLKKLIFIIVIIISVSLSMYFSLGILRSDTFEYHKQSDNTYQLKKFSNPGYIEELTIDTYMDIVYDESHEYTPIKSEPQKIDKDNWSEARKKLVLVQEEQLKVEQENALQNAKKLPSFTLTNDETKLITSIREYAFNGDGYLKTVYIGKNVTDIDGKAFYSCWALKAIYVHEDNPNYCDIDGVLYNKDKTQVIVYPCDHDQYLREKYGYPKELFPENAKDSTGKEIISAQDYEKVFAEYQNEVMTYVIPQTVTEVGELCFNYSNLKTVYLPHGLKKIGNLGFFEMPNMSDFYTYKSMANQTDTSINAINDCEVYLSLPDTLETIGTDAFSFNKNMNYIYIPKSVTYIGHHAFWDTCYKEGNSIKGIAEINVERSEEDFKYKKQDDENYQGVKTGDQWVPIYDYNLLKKLPVNYNATRKTIE